MQKFDRSYSGVVVGKLFWKAKHPYLFLLGILSIRPLMQIAQMQQSGLRGGCALVSSEHLLPTCAKRQEPRVPFFLFISTQEWTRLCIVSVSEVQSLQRPALLHRCGLNLAVKIKLPVVAVGDKMPAEAGKRQHDNLGVFKSLI